MKALTLRQPWCWIILHLNKRIENRTRNLGNYRGPICLHSSSEMSSSDWWDAYEFVRARLGAEAALKIPKPTGKMQFGHPDLPRGVIFAQCDVVGDIHPRDANTLGLFLGLTGDDQAINWYDQTRDWYTGRHAYLLDHVEPTPLIACKGALGFWTVPDAVLAELPAEKQS